MSNAHREDGADSAPSSSSGNAILSIENLTLEIGNTTILDGVDLTITEGQVLGVAGESGSGKSMTALAVLGLLPRALVTGRIAYGGEDLLTVSEARWRDLRGTSISMIFQDPLASFDPVIRIGDQICEIMQHRLGMSKEEARKQAIDLLKRVEIPDPESRCDAYPHQLSGGQRQRAMIAMALAGKPRLVLADEPTTALDVTVQSKVLGLMSRLQKQDGLSMMLISHDLRVMSHIADELVVMYAGRVVEAGRARAVLTDQLHPYTAALTRSVPSVRQKSDIGEPIPGTPPNLSQRPNGCAFHPRCPMARDVCRTEVPPLREIRKGRRSACHFAEELVK